MFCVPSERFYSILLDYRPFQNGINVQESKQEVTKVVSLAGSDKILLQVYPFLLTFSTLWANSADDKLMIIFLFYPENRT